MSSSRMRTLLFLGCLLLQTAAPIRAQEPSPSPVRPVSILFDGNSFTYGGSEPVCSYNAQAVTDENADAEPVGGIPGIFKKFADEAHRAYDVHVEVVGGKDLAYHYQHSPPLIAQAKWDVVVLQGYSTEALPEKRGGKPEDFIKHIRLFCQAIHKANPRTKVYLYETWPRVDLIYPDNAPYHDTGDTNQMADDLHSGFRVAQEQVGTEAQVIGVGDRWQGAILDGLAQANPYQPLEPGKLDLWGQDYYHPSVYGSYLAALIFFAEIDSADVVALGPSEQAAHDLGIAPADADKLQRRASVARTGDQ